MQMQLEEKDRSIILKDYFSLRTDPFIFTSMALELLNQSYKTSWIFPALKSTSHFGLSPQCPVGQTQVEKPTLVIATNQGMPHHT